MQSLFWLSFQCSPGSRWVSPPGSSEGLPGTNPPVWTPTDERAGVRADPRHAGGRKLPTAVPQALHAGHAPAPQLRAQVWLPVRAAERGTVPGGRGEGAQKHHGDGAHLRGRRQGLRCPQQQPDLPGGRVPHRQILQDQGLQHGRRRSLLQRRAPLPAGLQGRGAPEQLH